MISWFVLQLFHCGVHQAGFCWKCHSVRGWVAVLPNRLFFGWTPRRERWQHARITCSLCTECQEVFETVGNRPSFIVFNLYKATIGIIVGATLGFLFALVIVAIGFVVFCRRRFVTALLMGYGRWDRSMELNSLFTCCRLPRKEQTDIHIHSLR